MKKIMLILGAVGIGVIGLGVWYRIFYPIPDFLLSPLGREKPLAKYSFEQLRETIFPMSPLTFDKKLKEGTGFTSYLFYFHDGSKKVSGLANVPSANGTYPVIIQFRGFIDKEKYTTGEGVRRSSEVFAQNGFISLSPDFLGYGESDDPSQNSIEERFQTYTTALSLIASLDLLNQALEKAGEKARADPSQVGIWGHSNGGHIALAVSSILGKPYPLVLWNPVTKSFPYSILYFTDEFEDHGKALRKAIADFEKEYDSERYSPLNYYSWIASPIQLHQAEDDEAVPKRWSDQFVEIMEKLSKDTEYYTYPAEDHNFSKGSWNTVMERSIEFLRSRISKNL